VVGILLSIRGGFIIAKLKLSLLLKESGRKLTTGVKPEVNV
jgi:hypothetical protein